MYLLQPAQENNCQLLELSPLTIIKESIVKLEKKAIKHCYLLFSSSEF